jgi:hypothetical protein
VRRLRTDSHGSSRATRGECRRLLRRKQRTRSGGTANCSWRIWRWPGASRPWPSRRQRGASVARRSEGEGLGGIGLARPQMWSGSVLPAAVVSRFGWHRRWRKGQQSYTLCEREWLTGPAAKHGDPTSNCAGMPDVFLQCMCVSRGGSARELENPEVRRGVGIANQSGSIVLSYGPRHPATPIPR